MGAMFTDCRGGRHVIHDMLRIELHDREVQSSAAIELRFRCRGSGCEVFLSGAVAVGWLAVGGGEASSRRGPYCSGGCCCRSEARRSLTVVYRVVVFSII